LDSHCKPLVRYWHHSEVLTGAGHDRYRPWTRPSAGITSSAEFDPERTAVRRIANELRQVSRDRKLQREPRSTEATMVRSWRRRPRGLFSRRA